jgi:hypothetical protein
MSQEKALRTILQVRHRQAERFALALTGQRALLGQREQEVTEADAGCARAREDESARREQRLQLMNTVFTPQALRVAEIQIEEGVAAVGQADKLLQRAQAVLADQRNATEAARAEVRRNDQRIEQFEQRIAALLAERDRAVEEQADEEA